MSSLIDSLYKCTASMLCKVLRTCKDLSKVDLDSRKPAQERDKDKKGEGGLQRKDEIDVLFDCFYKLILDLQISVGISFCLY